MAPPGVDEKTLPPADKKADGIGVVSIADLKLLRVLQAGSDPEQTALTTDGQRLFVANEDTGLATALSVDDGRTLATFKVGGEPEGVEMRPDGGVVYVTSEEDGQVSVIDVATLKLLTTFKVGPRPRSTTFLPDSSRAYVTSENGGSVAVVDAQKHKVLETIQLSGELIRPMGGAASPDGSQVFISTGRGKNVVVIDTGDQQAGGLHRGGRPPVGHRHVARRQDAVHGQRAVERRVDRRSRDAHGEGQGESGQSAWGVVSVPWAGGVLPSAA